MTSAVGRTERVVRAIATTAVDNERRFSDLDAVVGDGDLGFSLARGFEQVLELLDQGSWQDPSQLLKQVALTIARRVGGTSGPLWGTAFLRAGVALGGTPEPSAGEWVAALRAAADGVAQRGQAALGDKTLLDALVPAIDRLERELELGTPTAAALERAAATAREAAEATAGMVARRGRASYAGERSRGSLDAGAVAVAVIFAAVGDVFRDLSEATTFEEEQ